MRRAAFRERLQNLHHDAQRKLEQFRFSSRVSVGYLLACDLNATLSVAGLTDEPDQQHEGIVVRAIKSMYVGNCVRAYI